MMTTPTPMAGADTHAAYEILEYPEYDYESDNEHMTADEAAERYKSFKASDPQAIVSLEELPCGHYAVNVYKTDWQKQAFIRRTYQSLVRRALSRLFGAFAASASK